MQPTQLTHEEAVAYVRRILERIHDARLLYASEECFQNRPMFLGWSQYSERQGEVVTFGVKKTLQNATPQQLVSRTWQLQTNNDNLRRLGPSHLQTHIMLLQKITDDILVIDRRTEDQSRADESGQSLVFRTVHVLFRVTDDGGVKTLGIKTLESNLDTPVADRMLRDDEVCVNIFYWIRVSAAVQSDEQDITTVSEFSGSNLCARENLAALGLEELMFLAIRLAVAPFLLKL